MIYAANHSGAGHLQLRLLTKSVEPISTANELQVPGT